MSAFYLLLLIFGCAGHNQNDYQYRIPEKINDGLEVSSLAAEGIDGSEIIEANNLILKKSFTEIHSLLIMKNGKLVLEEYYNGYQRNKLHDLRSVTKSVISALIGIAINQNSIKSVDEKMFSFFPEYSGLRNEYNSQITLNHLLTMTAGFEWDEWSNTYISGQNSERQRYNSGDWIKFILERDMIGTPGYAADKVGFIYCGGCPTLLSAIIGKTTGKSSLIFAREYLFKPLGIKNFIWFGTKGITDGASGLRLRPRDMAKIGLLYLDGGRWNGTQIIPGQWIDDSRKQHIGSGNASGYGYLWWVRNINIKGREINYFYASGNGGQSIMVCHELKLVVVLTGGNYEKSLAHRQVNQIINDYILPAVAK